MENSSEASANPINQGCGSNNTQINVHVSPTTGGDFYLNVEADCTVENLKKLVSKRLKVPRDRICLLFRDKWVEYQSTVTFLFSQSGLLQAITRRKFSPTWNMRWV